MLLKYFLIGKQIEHDKILSYNHIGKIIRCKFDCFDDNGRPFGKEIHLNCSVEYKDKNDKTRYKTIEEDIEYLNFV